MKRWLRTKFDRVRTLIRDRTSPKDFVSEWLRERIELKEERRLLLVSRSGRDVCWPDEESDPLVTIRIATYNRGRLVADRSIASALAQTYPNIEVLVIGDACDEPTREAVEGVADPRVHFINLPARGLYPTDDRKRWMVAGSVPMNVGRLLAKGAWIAPCDDDDELSPDHVEVLLTEARARRLEMIYSKARMEIAPRQWEVVGSTPLTHGRITHGSVLYSTGLRFMPHSNTSWKLNEPSDWNLWRRMKKIGVKIGFLDRVTYKHYLEAYRRDIDVVH